MPELNFEQDIAIDESALDVELLRQATLFYKYSKYETEKKNELAIAQETVKTIRSGLIREAGNDKTIKNAQQVEAFYRNDPEYQAAKEEALNAEYEANMATSAVWAFNGRKKDLENLIKLAAMDYFARPTEPRDLAKEADLVKQRDEKTKTSRARTKRKMSRK